MIRLLETLSLLFPSGGYYFEAGAHDGIGDSHTYALEKLGTWEGLCVEPSDAFRGLKQSRKCAVDSRCLWEEDLPEIPFRQVSGNAIELSGIPSCFRDTWDRETRPHTETTKEAVSLPTLFMEHKTPPVIEFFGLDTEGSEFEILSGHDFSRWRFLTALVEHNSVTEQQDKVTDLLASRGMLVAYTDEANTFYTAEEIQIEGRILTC